MIIPFALSAASLGLVIISFFFFRWYIARKTAARELLADYREEVNRLIAGIDAATDRDSLLIEERIKTLKKLLDDTDRRIGLYMRELQRSHNGEALYSSLGRGIRAALDSRAPAEESAQTGAQIQGAGREKEAVSANTERQQPELPLLETPPAYENAASRKRGAKKPKIKTQIAEMAAQGAPPEKIASRLKLSIAEVELALNLLRRNHE